MPAVAPNDTITSVESNNQNDAIRAIETLLGIPNSSANVNAVWYMLKNTSGGHNHDGTNSRSIAVTAHGAASHTGNIFPAASDQILGAGSISVSQRTAASVSTPASGSRVLFMDSADAHLKVKDSTGTAIDLEAVGSGGTGAPTTATYLTATADGGLSNEVVVGATPQNDLAGTASTWAAPVVRDLHAGVAHSVMARLNVANVFTLGPQTFQTGGTGTKGVIVKGSAGQTATLQEWQNSSGTALTTVSPAGVFTFPSTQFGTPVAVVAGTTTPLPGTAATLARSDHVHSNAAAGGGGGTFGTNPADISGTGETAGTSALYAREDHVHYHGILTGLVGHHLPAHADTDHTGPNKLSGYDHGVFRSTQPIINFKQGGRIADNNGAGRMDITLIPSFLPFVSGGSVTLTSAPAAEQILANGGRRYIHKIDLQDAYQVRLTCAVATAGFTGTNIRVRYGTLNNTVTLTDYVIMGSTEVTAPIDVTGIADSGWIDLVAGAKNPDRYLIITSIGGNGTVSPVVGETVLQIR